jgi:pyruvate/2-oxoglutarate dehydrogenase complex dihydrolipoamide dehydrogenase (E3) component
LGLKAAHVAYGKDGIKRNAGFQTSNPKIFVVNGGFDSFHAMTAARREGEWLAGRLFAKRPPAALQSARIIAADPEIAVIGLSEAQAQERRGAIRVLRAGFCDSPRAQALQPMRHPVTGHVKIVTDGHNRILGAGIVGPQARELIGIFGLALANRLKAQDLGVLAGSEPALMDVCRVAALASAPQTGKVSSWRIFAALSAALGARRDRK